MLGETFAQLFRKYRLFCYRKLFAAVREKPGSLSATEAFSADIIHLLGSPTVSQFAETIGISQPNATYKVNQLTAKGYLEKHVQARDRREVVLTTSEKFTGYFDEDKEDALQQKIRTAAAQFTPAELDSAERVLLALVSASVTKEECYGYFRKMCISGTFRTRCGSRACIPISTRWNRGRTSRSSWRASAASCSARTTIWASRRTQPSSRRASQAYRTLGSGCSGSRFLNGTLKLHLELEDGAGRSSSRKDAVVTFSTGFQSNLGIISAHRRSCTTTSSWTARTTPASMTAASLSYGKMLRYQPQRHGGPGEEAAEGARTPPAASS